MRKLYISAAVLLVACAAVFVIADEQRVSIATGTNTYGTATFREFDGVIDEIMVDAAASVTGTVLISYQPLLSNLAAVNIATNTLTADDTFRPSFDRTAVDGAALTSDPPAPVYLSGETVTMVVTNSATGTTWNALIKYKPTKTDR